MEGDNGEDIGSDSNFDETDTYSPISEDPPDTEDSESHPEPTVVIAEQILDSLREYMKAEEAPESVKGEDAIKEVPDHPNRTDDSLSESEQEKPTSEIQEENNTDGKQDIDEKDDELSEQGVKDEKSDNLNEKEDGAPDSNDDESGRNPDDDIYDPIHVPVSELEPSISGFQSSSLGGMKDLENSSHTNFKDDFDEDINLPSFNETGEHIPINEEDLDDDLDEHSFDDSGF